MLLTLLAPQGAPGAVIADLAVTLGATTLSSGATVVSNVTADLSATLGAATLSSTATLTITPVTANLTVTLGAVVLASNVTVSGAAVAGYGVGGSNIADAFPIVGVVGVPPPVNAVVRQTH